MDVSRALRFWNDGAVDLTFNTNGYDTENDITLEAQAQIKRAMRTAQLRAPAMTVEDVLRMVEHIMTPEAYGRWMKTLAEAGGADRPTPAQGSERHRPTSSSTPTC